MRSDQVCGSLIGQCLGDALGFLVEGHPAVVCAHFAASLSPNTPPTRTRGQFTFGQYSDDSQLARELLQSFAELKRFDPADYAQRIAKIFAEERIVGRGRATEEAALRLQAGRSWTESGTPSPQAGNGSAMRAGPVGILFCRDHRVLRNAARDQGAITHLDPRASAGAIAVAASVALAGESEGTIDPSRFVSDIAAILGDFNDEFTAQLERLPSWIGLPPHEAVPHIARAGSAEIDNRDWDGISPFVIPSVLWSIYSFLRTPEDYWSTIRTAISVGGDVDTTAAMAGAISGAHVGLERLPPIARLVHDQGTWGFDALNELAMACFEIATT